MRNGLCRILEGGCQRGGKKEAANISPRPLARARERAVWNSGRMSLRGWPDFIDAALANLLKRSEALGPRAPVASKPNGMKSHPDWAHRVEWVESFRASAASAADVASPRAAELEESRSG